MAENNPLEPQSTAQNNAPNQAQAAPQGAPQGAPPKIIELDKLNTNSAPAAPTPAPAKPMEPVKPAAAPMPPTSPKPAAPVSPSAGASQPASQNTPQPPQSPKKPKNWKLWAMIGGIVVVAAGIGFAIYQQSTNLFQGSLPQVQQITQPIATTDSCQLKRIAFKAAFEKYKSDPSANNKSEVFRTGTNLCESDFDPDPTKAKCTKLKWDWLMTLEYFEEDRTNYQGTELEFREQLIAQNCKEDMCSADPDSIKKDIQGIVNTLQGDPSEAPSGSEPTGTIISPDSLNAPSGTSETATFGTPTDTTLTPAPTDGTVNTNTSTIDTSSTSTTPGTATTTDPNTATIDTTPTISTSPTPTPTTCSDPAREDIENNCQCKPPLVRKDANSPCDCPEEGQSWNPTTGQCESGAPAPTPALTPLAPDTSIGVNDGTTGGNTLNEGGTSPADSSTSSEPATISDPNTVNLLNFLIPEVAHAQSALSVEEIFPTALSQANIDNFKQRYCAPSTPPTGTITTQIPTECTIKKAALVRAILDYTASPTSTTTKKALIKAYDDYINSECDDTYKTSCDKNSVLWTMSAMLDLQEEVDRYENKILTDPDPTCKEKLCAVKGFDTSGVSILAVPSSQTDTANQLPSLNDINSIDISTTENLSFSATINDTNLQTQPIANSFIIPKDTTTDPNQAMKDAFNKHLKNYQEKNCKQPTGTPDKCQVLLEQVKKANDEYIKNPENEDAKRKLMLAYEEAVNSDCNTDLKTPCDKNIYLWNLAGMLDLQDFTKKYSEKINADPQCKERMCAFDQAKMEEHNGVISDADLASSQPLESINLSDNTINPSLAPATIAESGETEQQFAARIKKMKENWNKNFSGYKETYCAVPTTTEKTPCQVKQEAVLDAIKKALDPGKYGMTSKEAKTKVIDAFDTYFNDPTPCVDIEPCAKFTLLRNLAASWDLAEKVDWYEQEIIKLKDANGNLYCKSLLCKIAFNPPTLTVASPTSSSNITSQPLESIDQSLLYQPTINSIADSIQLNTNTLTLEPAQTTIEEENNLKKYNEKYLNTYCVEDECTTKQQDISQKLTRLQILEQAGSNTDETAKLKEEIKADLDSYGKACTDVCQEINAPINATAALGNNLADLGLVETLANPIDNTLQTKKWWADYKDTINTLYCKKPEPTVTTEETCDSINQDLEKEYAAYNTLVSGIHTLESENAQKDKIKALFEKLQQKCDYADCEYLERKASMLNIINEKTEADKVLEQRKTQCESTPLTCDDKYKQLEQMVKSYDEFRDKESVDGLILRANNITKLLDDIHSTCNVSQCDQIAEKMDIYRVIGKTKEVITLSNQYNATCREVLKPGEPTITEEKPTVATPGEPTITEEKPTVATPGKPTITIEPAPTTSTGTTTITEEGPKTAGTASTRTVLVTKVSTAEKKVADIEQEVKKATTSLDEARKSLVTATPAERPTIEKKVAEVETQLKQTQDRLVVAKQEVTQAKQELTTFDQAREELRGVAKTGPETTVYLGALLLGYFLWRRKQKVRSQ